MASIIFLFEIIWEFNGEKPHGCFKEFSSKVIIHFYFINLIEILSISIKLNDKFYLIKIYKTLFFLIFCVTTTIQSYYIYKTE